MGYDNMDEWMNHAGPTYSVSPKKKPVVSKKKKKNRKVKYVVWLAHWSGDMREDEWVSVWAHNAAGARREADFEKSRFTINGVMTAKQFKKMMGFGA